MAVEITQAPGSRCSLPQQIKFFIDPFWVVGYFKTCPINKTKSKIESYNDGSVWKFISNANLNGAHDSLIDAKAQTDIFIHKYFGPFIDQKHTVQQIDAIFTVYVVVCFLAKGGVGKKEWQRYDDKNQGRHDFQIDLGIAIMNYGISTEWKDTTEARPNFIWQTAFLPCDCKKCFFCMNGFTNGIQHCPLKKAKVVVQYKCGTRVKTNQCTGERVDLGLGCTYCRMCYRKLVGTTASEQKAAVRKNRTSSMGCPICKEPICKECWVEGYDKHA